MVCIHCGKDTKVVNSRLQRRSNQVWRRRHCLSCGATFTTGESPQYELSWTVKTKSGAYEPFSRDKLFLSLYRSLKHRKAALNDAGELAQTITSRLRPQITDGQVYGRTIKETAQVALHRFDRTASIHYAALHD